MHRCDFPSGSSVCLRAVGAPEWLLLLLQTTCLAKYEKIVHSKFQQVKFFCNSFGIGLLTPLRLNNLFFTCVKLKLDKEW